MPTGTDRNMPPEQSTFSKLFEPQNIECEISYKMWRKNANFIRHSPARSDQKDPGLSRHPVQTAANFPCSIGKRYGRFYQLINSADGTSSEVLHIFVSFPALSRIKSPFSCLKIEFLEFFSLHIVALSEPEAPVHFSYPLTFWSILSHR
jgi:hypothetical protein